MIDYVEEVRSAVCDVCGMSLMDDENLNYAELVPKFGYGSPLDGLVVRNRRYDLCHKCYTYVVEQLGNITVNKR